MYQTLSANACRTAPARSKAGAIHGSHGFTIIELLITLAALGILLALSVPSFMDIADGVNTNARADELMTAISIARSEAIKRGDEVHVCASNVDGTDCDADMWSQGWIVFFDANGDADGDSGSIDGGDTVIRVFGASRSPSAVTFSTDLVTFDNMGFNAAGAIQQFEITPPGESGSYGRCVELSVVGRPVMTEGECP